MSDALVQSSRMAGNDNLPEYRAYSLGQKSQTKLMLVNAQSQIIGMPAYSHYTDAFCLTSSTFNLLFSNGAYQFKGERFTHELLGFIQDERVRIFRVYHRRFYNPPEQESPIITSISRHPLQKFMQAMQDGIKSSE